MFQSDLNSAVILNIQHNPYSDQDLELHRILEIERNRDAVTEQIRLLKKANDTAILEGTDPFARVNHIRKSALKLLDRRISHVAKREHY